MILCTDPILQEILKNKGVDSQVYDSVLPTSEKQEMLESLDKFASEWFLDKSGFDYTDYRGVSVGGALHDELMTLFQLLYHFTWIINKVDNKKSTILYQSLSCKMPKVVEELIDFSAGVTKTTNDSYPYLCFRGFHTAQSKETNYSVVNLDMSEGENVKKCIVPRFKYLTRVIISKILNLFSFKKKFIYVSVLRSLVPFFRLHLDNKKNDIGLILEHNSKKSPYMDSPGSKRMDNIRKIIRYNLKGVRTDSLKVPFFKIKSSYVKNNERLKRFEDKFKKNYCHSAFNLLKDPESNATKFFIDYFERFFLKVQPRFIKAIDYYYKKYDKRKIAGYLVEMIHPVKVQILSNLKKKTFLVPPNFVLHNQYFSEYIISCMSQYFRPIAVSEYDRTRYTRLGFKQENVELMDPGFFDEFRKKLKIFKTIETIEGANVLIIPAWMHLLHTFRGQISASDLVYYFSDILDVLEELKVFSVKIRTVPDVSALRINATHHTAFDCYQLFLNIAKQRVKKSYSFDISFSPSLRLNLEEDVQNSDIVIGVISGTIFETLLYGRDYIVYDNSVSPFPGGKEGNLVQDGIIKRNRNKEELREHLTYYKPIDRDFVFREYYPTIFSEKKTLRNINACFGGMFN